MNILHILTDRRSKFVS